MDFDEYVELDAPTWYLEVARAIAEDRLDQAKNCAEAQLRSERSVTACIAAANVFLAQGDTKGAASLANEAQQATRGDGQLHTALVSHLLAKIKIQDDDVEAAEVLAADALGSFKAMERELGEASVLVTQAKCKTETENALELLNEAQTLFRKNNCVKGEAAAMYVAMRKKLSDGKVQHAKEAATAILRLFENSGDVYQVASSHLLLVQLFADLGDIQSAVLSAQRAAEFFGKAGSSEKKVQALCTFANALRVAGQMEDATRAAEAALSISQTIKDRRAQASAYCMMATICDSVKEHSRAVYLLERAVRIYNQLQEKKEEAQTLESIANVSLKMFSELDDSEEPLRNCRKAMKLYEELGMESKAEAGYLLQATAFAALALDRSDDAMSLAQESVTVFQLLTDRRGEAVACNVLAQIHWSRKEPDRARSLAKQAMKLAEEAGDASEAAWARKLSQTYGGSSNQYGSKSSAKQTTSSQRPQYSDIFMYMWGKEYALFYDFTLRGTSQQATSMQKRRGMPPGSPPVSAPALDDEEARRIEVQLDVDWESLARVE